MAGGPEDSFSDVVRVRLNRLKLVTCPSAVVALRAQFSLKDGLSAISGNELLADVIRGP